MNTRFLGIDYGSKRIGVATANESRIATPLLTIRGTSAAVQEIAQIVRERNVQVIVIGESKDFKGVENPIMEKIIKFKETLQKELGDRVQIIFEPEFLTSHQAEKIQGKNTLLDASAAALILQSYLDRNLL